MPRKRTLRQMLQTIALTLLSLYGLLVLLVFVNQRKLLYFPNTKPARPTHLKPWPSDTDFRGFVGVGAKVARGTVVVFHGNAGRAADRDYFVDALEPLGFRVVLAEYPGYGGRPGAITEASLVVDGRASVAAAKAQWGDPVYVVGESLGCGVAAAVASDAQIDVRGLMLITPWDALPELAQATYPFLPARWMVRDRFDSVSNLAKVDFPVAVLLAENDEVIPTRLGKRLFDSLTTTKRLWTFPGAGHNTWPTGRDEAWWREATDFLRKDT